jgi:hypothetical protein
VELRIQPEKRAEIIIPQFGMIEVT